MSCCSANQYSYEFCVSSLSQDFVALMSPVSSHTGPLVPTGISSSARQQAPKRPSFQPDATPTPLALCQSLRRPPLVCYPAKFPPLTQPLRAHQAPAVPQDPIPVSVLILLGLSGTCHMAECLSSQLLVSLSFSSLACPSHRTAPLISFQSNLTHTQASHTC